MATLEERLLAVQTQLQQPADDQAARQRLREEKDVLMLLLKQKVLAQKKEVLAQEEKNLLLKERAAAQPQAAPAGSAITTTEEQLRQVVTEAVQQAAQQSAVEMKGFSEVGSLEAEQLLEQVGIVEVNGHEVDPINLPADTPECSPFNFDPFPSENLGTPALLAHHQAQLKLLGVKFGRGGYSMFDLHNSTALYTVRTSDRSYQGSIDGCVAPYGLAVASAPKQCRVAYEHNQSPVQKQAYRDAHPQESLGTVRGTGNVCFAATCKGQAITATVGAYAYNNFPLMFDLTDGVVHHMLHVRGNELFEWTELTPTQAYYLQAKLLNDADNHKLLTQRSLALESIPEELQNPMKKLRSLRPSSALKEQLDSIVPQLASDEEKLQVTLELMTQWACRGQLPMPEAVQAMYGL